jgi:hypothetical protein
MRAVRSPTAKPLKGLELPYAEQELLKVRLTLQISKRIKARPPLGTRQAPRHAHRRLAPYLHRSIRYDPSPSVVSRWRRRCNSADYHV